MFSYRSVRPLAALALLLTACAGVPAPGAPVPGAPVAAAATAGPTPASSIAPVVLKEEARNIGYTDAAGQTHLLSEHKGKYVLLVFFAHWCGVCQKELPVIEAYRKEAEAKGAVVVPIEATSVSQDLVKAFGERYNITMPLYHDPSGNAAKTYLIKNFPTSYLISPDFVAQENVIGKASLQFYKQRQALYQGPAPAAFGLLN